jgi:hypothetical protein
MSKWKKKIKIQFTDTCFESATKFLGFEEAQRAAKAYSEDRKYTCEVFWCDHCKKFHIRPTPLRALPEQLSETL